MTIHREALRLIDPQPYFQPLHLAPARELSLAATRLGTVRVIRRKVDESLDREAVAVELDATELDLRLRRAEADLKVAEIELEQAKAAGQISLAQARLALSAYNMEEAMQAAEQAATLDARMLEAQIIVLRALSVKGDHSAAIAGARALPQEALQGEDVFLLADLLQLAAGAASAQAARASGRGRSEAER